MPTTRDSSRMTAQDWEREWRERINVTLDRAMDQQNQTAVLLEKLTQRVESLEEGPKQARAWLNSANQGLSTVIAIVAVLVSIFLYALGHVTIH